MSTETNNPKLPPFNGRWFPCLACGQYHGDEIVHQNFLLLAIIRRNAIERAKQILEAW